MPYDAAKEIKKTFNNLLFVSCRTTMGKLEQIFPKDNYFLIFIYAVSMLLAVFDLSFTNIIYLLVIDTLAFFLFLPFAQKLFYYFYPQYLFVKDLVSAEKVARINLDSQKAYFNLLSKFPEDRCLFAFLLSFLKVLPTGLFVAYTTNVSDSFFLNLAYFYLADTFILLYAFSLLFIQLHELTSEEMKRLKGVEGWNNNYHLLRPASIKDRFSYIQNFVLFSMIVHLLFVAYFIPEKEYRIYLTFFYLSAIFCLGSIQYYFQNYFRNSLISMFHYLEQDFSEPDIKILPLHTSPILAGFESTINQLAQRLKQREVEISNWLDYESQQYYLRSLGEITALVAHDIKSPLHVMQMSMDIINNPLTSDEKRKKYLYVLERNLNQTVSFTQTLMSYLRGEDQTSHSSFEEVHNNLIDLFETQYQSDIFSKLRVEITPSARCLNFNIGQLNLMHIFYNLYQNAFNSILNHSPGFPLLKIDGYYENSFACIRISDNGQGIDEVKYAQLTGADYILKSHNFKSGLGLRITKTIVQRLDGELILVPSVEGACFEVKLPASSLPRTLEKAADISLH